MSAGTTKTPLVGVLMGSNSDYPVMVAVSEILLKLGVPIKSKALKGLDSLLSTVNMPPGIPVATMAIDGAKNAGLMATVGEDHE